MSDRQTVTYSERFSDLAGEPTGVLTTRTARRRDRRGLAYTVTLGTPRAPDRVLEVCWNNSHLGVWFFNDHRRRSVHYSFDRHDDTWLFLAGMTVWTYPDATARLRNEASTIRDITFTSDGLVRDVSHDKTTNTVTSRDIADVDVSTHWEPVPVFGRWRSVARHECTTPADG